MIKSDIMNEFFLIDNLEIRKDQLFFILGPCVIESESFVLKLAEEILQITEELDIPFIFKASFDKANRTSIHSFRGPGLEEGIKILKRVREEYKIPVLTDIHEPWQAEAIAEAVSALQIPAFLSRQTNLLVSAGKTGLPVNIKKGQFMSPQDMPMVAEKIKETGNLKILLTERGTFFGYRNLVVDFRSIPIMKKSGFPVILDVTHSLQKPSADSGVTGGDPEFIPVLAASGVVSGVNGLFMEVHPEPDKALSDGSNSLDLKNLKPLLIKLKKIYNIDQ
jgi:2-dehydro-3-deoxyphosphooctonate aldolase (KDO 8-P synthase)